MRAIYGAALLPTGRAASRFSCEERELNRQGRQERQENQKKQEIYRKAQRTRRTKTAFLCVLCLQPVMLRVQPVRVRPREIG
jgi:uncharacterized membrane protein